MLKHLICSTLRLGCMSFVVIFTLWNPYWVHFIVRWGTNHDWNNTFPQLFPVMCWPVYREYQPFCSKMNFTPRKWPAMWGSLNQAVTVWPMQCSIFSLNRALSLTMLCGCTVLNWSKWPPCQGERSSCFGFLIFLLMFTLQIASLFYLYHIFSIWGGNQWTWLMFPASYQNRKGSISIG